MFKGFCVWELLWCCYAQAGVDCSCYIFYLASLSIYDQKMPNSIFDVSWQSSQEKIKRQLNSMGFTYDDNLKVWHGENIFGEPGKFYVHQDYETGRTSDIEITFEKNQRSTYDKINLYMETHLVSGNIRRVFQKPIAAIDRPIEPVEVPSRREYHAQSGATAILYWEQRDTTNSYDGAYVYNICAEFLKVIIVAPDAITYQDQDPQCTNYHFRQWTPANEIKLP